MSERLKTVDPAKVALLFSKDKVVSLEQLVSSMSKSEVPISELQTNVTADSFYR